MEVSARTTILLAIIVLAGTGLAAALGTMAAGDAGQVASSEDGSSSPTSADSSSFEPASSTPASTPISDRLAPAMVNHPDIEPLDVPELSLYQAALLHPSTGPADLIHVESLQPLPEELDAALARLVAAHAVASLYLDSPAAQQDPTASLVATATMASALDRSWPVLDEYKNAPVGQPTPDATPAYRASQAEEQAGEDGVAPPDPGQALVRLYEAMGFGADTVKALEAPAHQAAADLPREVRGPVATLLEALADYNQAAIDVVTFLAEPPEDIQLVAPASHDTLELIDQIREMEEELEDTPLQDLREATQDVHQALDAARSALEDTPASQVGHNVWTDPLDLIVVGSTGCDVFDAQPRTVACNETANLTAGPDGGPLPSGPDVQRSVSAPPVPTPLTVLDPEAAAAVVANASGLGEEANPGWHALVLDRGGNDTYLSNAGGAAPGGMRVEVDVTAGGIVETVQKSLVDENSETDDLCLPSTTFCIIRESNLGIQGLGSQIASEPDPEARGDTEEIAAGVAMVSAVLDRGGNDVYQSIDFEAAQGAARGLGLGLLVDEAGNDTYIAEAWAQGASQALGTGALVDLAGNDVYTLNEKGQAFAELPKPGLEVEDSGPYGQAACGLVNAFGVSIGRPIGAPFAWWSPGAEFTVADCVDGLGIFALRHARGTLFDAGGTDTYELESDRPTHGLTETDDDVLRQYVWLRAIHPDLSPATFVDLGGSERLPVPEVDGEPVPPSRVERGADGPNASAELWLHRKIDHDGAERSWKTAVNFIGDASDHRWVCANEEAYQLEGSPATFFATDGRECEPEPEGRGTIWCPASADACGEPNPPASANRPFCPMQPGEAWDPRAGCAPDPFGPEGRDDRSPELIGTAEPNERKWPVTVLLADATCTPVFLALSLRGTPGEEDIRPWCFPVDQWDQDTSSEESSQDSNRTLLVGSPTEVVDPPAMSILFATEGRADTTYKGQILAPPFPSGDNNGLLVDLGGQDIYLPGNETNPRGDGMLASTEQTGAGLLVDRGGASLEAGNRTVAHARQGTMAVLAMEGGLDVRSGDQSQAYAAEGGTSLLHLGNGSAGPSSLRAGDASQAFAAGSDTTASLLGSPTDDVYQVDGWGMGQCEGEATALFLEPGGDDTYDLGSMVGLGDCVRPPPVDEEQEAGDLPGTVVRESSGQLDGTSLFADVFGQDKYDVDEWPPRPADGVERQGSPGQDQAWGSGLPTEVSAKSRSTDGEGFIANDTRANASAPTVFNGVGADNLRNLADILGGLCELGTDDCDASARSEGGREQAGLLASFQDALPEGESVSMQEPGSAPGRAELGAGWENDENGTRVWADYETGAALSRVLRETVLGEGIGARDLTIEVGEPSSQAQRQNDRLVVSEDRCEDTEPLGPRSELRAPATDSPWACLVPEGDPVPARLGQETGAQSVLAPAELASCNCSVRISIQPLNERTVWIAHSDELLPRGVSLTTMATTNGEWVEGWERLNAPWPVPEERVNHKLVVAGGGGELFVNLSALPSTTANVHLDMELWDAAAEETGGLVPPATGSWSGPLMHTGTATNASTVDYDGDTWLMVGSDGALSSHTRVLLGSGAETMEEFHASGMIRVSEAAESQNFVDLPQLLGASAPVHGAEACAAALLSGLNGGEGGYCWTGQSLATFLPLEDQQTPEQVVVRQHGNQPAILPVGEVTLPEDDEAFPRVSSATETVYRVDDHPRRGDDVPVRGIPAAALQDGQEWASQLLGSVADEEGEPWIEFTIEAAGPGAIGASLEPGLTLHAGVARELIMGGSIADPVNETQIEEGEVNQTWRPVVLDGRFVDPSHMKSYDLECTWLEHFSLTERRWLVYQAEEPTCLAEVDDRNVTLRIHVDEVLDHKGHYGDAWFVDVSAAVLGADGEMHRFPEGDEDDRLGLHLDARPTRGAASFSPSQAQVPRLNASLFVERPFHQSGILRSDRTDLVDVFVETRERGDQNWTRVKDVDPEVATSRDLVPLDLSTIAGEGGEWERDLRVSFVDESGNAHSTDSERFRYDTRPPTIENASLVLEDGRPQVVLETSENETRLHCRFACHLEPVDNPVDQPIRPHLDLEGRSLFLGEVRIPVSDIVMGIPYEVTVGLEDALGNRGTDNATLQTPERLQVDASAMEGRLLNRTTTLVWGSQLNGGRASGVQIANHAQLQFPNASCPLLTGFATVESFSIGVASTNEIGPLSVQCPAAEEGADATLEIVTHAALEDWIGRESVPVQIDTRAPRLGLEAPAGWTNDTAEVQVSIEDALDVDTQLTLDGVPVEPARQPATGDLLLAVDEPGNHVVRVTAEDEAGNTNETSIEVPVDREPPTLWAEWAGTSEDLGLLEVSLDDELSGAHRVRALTPGQPLPWVNVPEEDTALLAVPLGAANQIEIEGIDRAGNWARQVLDLEVDASIVEGPDPQLTIVDPSTAEVVFATEEAERPIVVATTEAGDQIRQTLPRGQVHTVELSPLAPGSTVNVTTALVKGAEISPIGHGSITLPEDEIPPASLTGVETERTDEGVLVSWDRPVDDVGIQGVLVQRDGQELARVDGERYRDSQPPGEALTYSLAAIDLAGNLGPWTHESVQASSAVAVKNVSFDPVDPEPGDPLSVSVILETEAKTPPELVALETWSGRIKLDRATSAGEHVTYTAVFPAPELTLGVEDPVFELTVRSDDRTIEQTVEPPIIAQVSGDQAAAENTIPLGHLGSLVALLLASAARLGRRCR